MTNFHKNSSNPKFVDGTKITFNVPNGFSENTFDYDLNLFETDNTTFYCNNFDGVKLFYWDNDLFDSMNLDEIQNYLNTTVVWKKDDPINICYNFQNTEMVANKIKVKINK